MNRIPNSLTSNIEGESFLPDNHAMPPSQEYRSDMIDYNRSHDFQSRAFWRMAVATKDGGVDPAVVGKTGIDDLMEATGFKNGKWVVKSPESSIDDDWNRTKELLSRVGNVYAKVSTAKGSSGFDEHLICVYIPDSTDRDSVEFMGNLLEEQGLDTEGYKPDAYTLMDVYPDRLDELGFDSEYRFILENGELEDCL